MFKEVAAQIGNNFHRKCVKTTGFCFKLLTRFTVQILVMSTVLVGLRQVFGDAIECDTNAKDRKKAIETKCWIEGVFIVKRLLSGTIGKDITKSGVGTPNPTDEFIHQVYYQWVIPVLLLQALFLYAPRVVWHVWENGLVEKLLKDAESPVVTDEWKGKKTILVRYMNEVSKKQHRLLVIKYFTCEIFAALVLLLNMLIMHWVFNDFWISYQPAVSALLHQNYTAFTQNSAILFPTQAKCEYHVFGSSGSTEVRDALCFLPQNTVNEKIFVFLYIWYIMLCFFTVVNLSVQALMLGLKNFRKHDIRRMCDRQYSKRFQGFYKKYSDYGYWFSLHLIHKNLNPVLFKDFVKDLMNSGDPKEATI